MKTRLPKPPPCPLSPDPAEWEIYADRLYDLGRPDVDVRRAQRTALGLKRGLKLPLMGRVGREGDGRWQTTVVAPGDYWQQYDAPRLPKGLRFTRPWLSLRAHKRAGHVFSTPWEYPGLAEARPDVVEGFLKLLPTLVWRPVRR